MHMQRRLLAIHPRLETLQHRRVCRLRRCNSPATGVHADAKLQSFRQNGINGVNFSRIQKLVALRMIVVIPVWFVLQLIQQTSPVLGKNIANATAEC